MSLLSDAINRVVFMFVNSRGHMHFRVSATEKLLFTCPTIMTHIKILNVDFNRCNRKPNIKKQEVAEC